MSAQTTGILVGSWPLGMPADATNFYRELAETVEQNGFDSLFIGDHLFAAGPNVDALALAANLVARTSRITIGTGVLQLALREPVATAKQVATIDLLSGGRFILGVGAGGEFADEWAAAAVPREGRGARLDEWLEIARQLWTGEEMAHEGQFRTVRGVSGSPLPTRPNGPPIWVGGRSDAALRRAARHDAWFAYASSPRRIGASCAQLDEYFGGRRPANFRVAAVVFTNVADSDEAARSSIERVLSTRYRQDFQRFIDAFCAVGTPDTIRSRLEQFRAAGATDLILSPQCPADEYLEQVETLTKVALG
jgi:alkanesulfonate monooxygenase SsuD/methylene tetrahydromethanopterin reductase-like flavin-dependent oxidoreductase (luciferase family)